MIRWKWPCDQRRTDSLANGRHHVRRADAVNPRCLNSPWRSPRGGLPCLDGEPVPGASLIVTPLLNGAFMGWYGSRRERRGNPPFFLATFRGGALFAFELSLARFLAIGG